LFSTQTAPVVELLTNWDLFIWGSVGGVAGFALAHALPYAVGLMGGHTRWPPALPQVLGVVLVVAINAFLGGVAALVIGDATLIRQAIAFGFSWPTIMKAGGETLERLADVSDKSERGQAG
jgi:hypothetical protein